MGDLTDRVDLPAQLTRPAEELAAEFRGTFGPETVAACLFDSYTRLAANARIDTYLPLLATRFARQRLAATARLEGHRMPETPEVLFVCVHNAGRSQMAAALLDHYATGRVHVRSAGSQPADQLNPAVVEALTEVGLDVSRQFPKPLTSEAVQASDVVITMGCGDACPVFPGKRYIDWALDDPAGQPLEEVRRIRNEIDRRVRALLAQLLPDLDPPAAVDQTAR